MNSSVIELTRTIAAGDCCKLCCAVVVDLGWESDLCSVEYLPFLWH